MNAEFWFSPPDALSDQVEELLARASAGEAVFLQPGVLCRAA